jgi:hypothetical protein
VTFPTDIRRHASLRREFTAAGLCATSCTTYAVHDTYRGTRCRRSSAMEHARVGRRACARIRCFPGLGAHRVHLVRKTRTADGVRCGVVSEATGARVGVLGGRNSGRHRRTAVAASASMAPTDWRRNGGLYPHVRACPSHPRTRSGRKQGRSRSVGRISSRCAERRWGVSVCVVSSWL